MPPSIKCGAATPVLPLRGRASHSALLFFSRARSFHCAETSTPFQCLSWPLAATQLFGDTVNTASRMQTSAPPGTIQLSEAAASALRALAPPDLFTLTLRGKFDVKGKGIMETYILSPPPPLSESGVPAPLVRAPSKRSPPWKRPSAVTRDRLGALTSENLSHHVELLGDMGLADVVDEAGGSQRGRGRLIFEPSASGSSQSLRQGSLTRSLPPPPATVSLASVATSAVESSPVASPVSYSTLLPRASTLPTAGLPDSHLAGGSGAPTAGPLPGVEGGTITRSMTEDGKLAARMNCIDTQPLVKHSNEVSPLVECPSDRGLAGNHRFVFSLRFVCPELEAQYPAHRCVRHCF